MKKVSTNEATEFQAVLIEEVYLRILRECHLHEQELLEMIANSSGLMAAKSLLNERPVQVGFRGLRRRQRLDFTVEHLVIQPRWRHLFVDKEIATAMRRLSTKSASSHYKGHRCDADDCPLPP